jgi:hypothetical protein
MSLSLLPNGGYNPATGAFIGASVSLGGWLGEPQTTQLSSGSLGLTFSSGGRISVQFKSDFYLSSNHSVLKGDWRYQQIGQPTFGLGPAVDGREEFPMEFVLYRIHQAYFRKISRGNAYIGIGLHYDQYDQIQDDRADAGEATPFTVYSVGYPKSTTSVGASAEFLLDTRDNPINASRGQYWNASLRTYVKGLGSEVNHQMLWSDFRAYVHPFGPKRNTLAVWNYLWFTFGRPPYLDLPAIGWDTYGRSGRGYVQGHIRGPNMVYTEFEYRMRFSRNDMWGGVAYLNLTASTPSNSDPFGKFDAGFGAGLRVKFTKRTNTNLAVDVGRGRTGRTASSSACRRSSSRSLSTGFVRCARRGGRSDDGTHRSPLPQARQQVAEFPSPVSGRDTAMPVVPEILRFSGRSQYHAPACVLKLRVPHRPAPRKPMENAGRGAGSPSPGRCLDERLFLVLLLTAIPSLPPPTISTSTSRCCAATCARPRPSS